MGRHHQRRSSSHQKYSSTNVDLKLFELVSYDGFVLEDSMQANEANDGRVDSKATISEKCQLRYLIDAGIVKHPKDLTKQDLLQVFDEILGYEMQALSNQPLAVSVYLLPYIYDLGLAAEHPLMLALCESVITFGGYYCEVLRNGSAIKDDDFNYSQLTFSSKRSRIVLEFRVARRSGGGVASLREVVGDQKRKRYKKVDLGNKTNIDAAEAELNHALATRLKFRRFLHLMCKGLGTQTEAKNVGKILKDVESCRKRFDELKALGLSTSPSSGIFNEEMFRTLRAHISPRVVVHVSNEHTIKTMGNLLDQLELILSLPTSFSGLVDRVEQLAELPPNVLAKCYFFSNALNEQGMLMQVCSSSAAVEHDIAEWTGIKESMIRSEPFQKFLKIASTFLTELLLKFSGNKPRCCR